MPRQGIAWEPIAFVVMTFLASIGLIAWGLTSAPQNAASNTENPVRTEAVRSES